MNCHLLMNGLRHLLMIRHCFHLNNHPLNCPKNRIHYCCVNYCRLSNFRCCSLKNFPCRCCFRCLPRVHGNYVMKLLCLNCGYRLNLTDMPDYNWMLTWAEHIPVVDLLKSSCLLLLAAGCWMKNCRAGCKFCFAPKCPDAYNFVNFLWFVHY